MRWPGAFLTVTKCWSCHARPAKGRSRPPLEDTGASLNVPPETQNLLRQLVRSTGLTPAEIRRFVDLDVLLVKRRYVEATLMRRLRRARRLRRDLGLSLDEVAIILRLLDRIEALQQAEAQRQRAYHCPRPARGRPAG